MPLSGRYWARVFVREFVPQLTATLDALEHRVLPAFDGIGKEAERLSRDAWDAYMSTPAEDEGDPAAYAESAQEMGVDHYMLLNGIRQGIMNLFASALYHAFEQQIMLFHRRQVLHPVEENDRSHFKFSVFKVRLKSCGIDVENFGSWRTVQELRLVANAVKHADGGSMDKLRDLRPDLFVAPGLPLEVGELTKHWRRPVFRPLVGEDFYVSLDSLRKYRDALVRFWEELAGALQSDES